MSELRSADVKLLFADKTLQQSQPNHVVDGVCNLVSHSIAAPDTLDSVVIFPPKSISSPKNSEGDNLKQNYSTSNFIGLNLHRSRQGKFVVR
jgi:hypothetical protein